MADYGKDVLRVLRSIEKQLAIVNGNLRRIDRKLDTMMPVDYDPFDPDDDDDVTEDDLPFVVPGSRYEDDLK